MMGLLVGDREGNTAVVLFASPEAAQKWRQGVEHRVETYGMVRVLSRNDAIFGEEP